MSALARTWLALLTKLLAVLALMLTAAAPAQAQTETVEYYALDAIGSVRVVLDANGNIVGRMDYGPYGEPLSSGAGLPSRAYAGLFRDDEAGLDHAQARSYQARTGRFNAPDPIYDGLFDPEKWNRYSYARNSPLAYTDPTGLNPNCILSSGRPGWCSGTQGGSGTARRPVGGGTGDFRGGGRGDDENDREEPGDDQDPRRPGDGGDIPVPVPPVPAPPNAPGPTPPGPNPPGPEDPTDPGETNDCLRLVDQLAYISPAGAESPLATGVMMMNLAKADPWRSKKHPSGFRDALTFDQGTDVFRHVVGHAGAVRGNAATGLVSVYELSIDLWQWAGGHQGAKAEVLGSLAGQASGISMVLSAGNPRVARRLIRPIICK